MNNLHSQDQKLGLRIREARKRMALSQQELSASVGFDHPQTVSQIETGERQVKASELARLAAALHTTFSELLQDEPLREPVVLWREQPETNYQKVETEFIYRSRNYGLVEKLSGVRAKSQLRSTTLRGDNIDWTAAAELAAEVGGSMNLGRVPAASLTKVLEEDFGVKIFYRPDLSGSAASAVGDFGHSILMNSSEAPWRRNYNFAHELFHLLTWDAMPPKRLRAEPILKERFEKLANCFASCLLLPADCVLAAFSERLSPKRAISYADLIDIAREFDVSTEALLWRLVNLRQIDHNDARRVLDDLKFRALDRTSMSGKWFVPGDLSERYVRLCYLCFHKGQISSAKLAELLGISVAEVREKVKSIEHQPDEATLSLA
jgi:XRE family transcriptional regulator, fatty acid utilization regulator